MKKTNWLTFFSTLIVLTIVIYACQKDNVNERSGFIEEVSLKEAHMIYGYVDDELKSRFSNQYPFLSPQWGHIQLLSLDTRHNAMYVPLGFNDLTGNYLHMLIMKDEGRLRSLLIEIQPDNEWLNNNKTVDQYKNLTGKLLFYSINGRFHQGYMMKDGEMISEYVPEQELRNPSVLMRLNQVSLSGSGVTVDGTPCTFGTFGCQELSEVEIVIGKNSAQTNYVYIYIPSTVYNSTPSGGNYSGYTWYPSGGSISYSPKVYTSFGIITNSLNNPCLKNTFNQFNSSFGATTDMGYLLQSVFGVSDGVDLQILESTSLSNLVDGDTQPFYTTVNGQTIAYKAIIRLNVNTLPGAAQEYVAATIYHEIIHAVLSVSGKLSEFDSHTKMVAYVNKMATALTDFFGPTLTSDEAKALAWGGLQGTLAYQVAITSNPSYDIYVKSVNARFKTRANGAGTFCQ